MQNISSKFLSLNTVKSFLKVNEQNSFANCDGILLIMPFGIVYGKFMEFTLDDPKTIADILINSSGDAKKSTLEDNINLIGDGSQIIIKDATVKYPTGINIKMNEIAIFCDQVCGYYPIDLSAFEDQIL